MTMKNKKKSQVLRHCYHAFDVLEPSRSPEGSLHSQSLLSGCARPVLRLSSRQGLALTVRSLP